MAREVEVLRVEVLTGAFQPTLETYNIDTYLDRPDVNTLLEELSDFERKMDEFLPIMQV
jgi:hypothetical protein